MAKSKPISMDKEMIANQVESVMNELVPRLTRRNYRYKLGQKQRKQLYDVLSLQEQHYNLDYKNMNKEEERKNLTQLLDRFSEIVFGTTRDPFDIIGEHFSKYFDYPDESDFMHNTNFKSYRDTLFRIVDKIYAENYLSEIGAYDKELSNDEKIGLFQHTREINTVDHKYLNKKHKKITAGVIDRYVRIYENLSSAFEKYVRLLVWIKILFDGKKPHYDKIKKDSLSNHVGLLIKDPMFRDLVSPINATLRNAIAHKPQTVYDPALQSIRFLDSLDIRKYIDIGYSDFVTKTKELGADVYVLSMIGAAINLRNTERMKKYFKNLKNPGSSQKHSK